MSSETEGLATPHDQPGTRDDTLAAPQPEPVDIGATLGRWNALIRRARIGRHLKEAALTLSSYAGSHGRDIKCGVARYAVDCEVGYSTARRYLAWFREVGLIELTRAGNHKAGRADEYRLTVGPAVHERLDIPEDDEYRKLIDEVNGSNKTAQKDRRARNQRSPKTSANTTEPAETSALTIESANGGYQRSFSTPSALTLDEPPPSTNTFQRPGDLPPGGAPPPDPRRLRGPSAPGNDHRKPPTELPTQPPALQRNHRPRARGDEEDAVHLAPVIDIAAWQAS